MKQIKQMNHLLFMGNQDVEKQVILGVRLLFSRGNLSYDKFSIINQYFSSSLLSIIFRSLTS